MWLIFAAEITRRFVSTAITRHYNTSRVSNPCLYRRHGRETRTFDTAVWEREWNNIVLASSYTKPKSRHTMASPGYWGKKLVKASPYDLMWGIGYRTDLPSFFLFFVKAFSFQLNSYEVLPSAIFWTSRGHRCRPLSPPVRAFIFIAHRVQHSRCSSIFIECCYCRSRAFRLSIFMQENYLRVCALGEN